MILLQELGNCSRIETLCTLWIDTDVISYEYVRAKAAL